MLSLGPVKLVDWARGQGISYRTAWRWMKDDVMPVPWRQLPTGTILVDVDESSTSVAVALYARVSSHDQRADLDRQLARLSTYAAGLPPTRAAYAGLSVQAVVNGTSDGGDAAPPPACRGTIHPSKRDHRRNTHRRSDDDSAGFARNHQCLRRAARLDLTPDHEAENLSTAFSLTASTGGVALLPLMPERCCRRRSFVVRWSNRSRRSISPWATTPRTRRRF
jgi:hypothetical protein